MGQLRKWVEYQPILNKLYPNTYNYFTWDDTFKYWGDPFNAKKVIESGKMVYLYIENDNEELLNKVLLKLQEESETSFNMQRELLYRNLNTTEVIYQLKLSVNTNLQEQEIL